MANLKIYNYANELSKRQNGAFYDENIYTERRELEFKTNFCSNANKVLKLTCVCSMLTNKGYENLYGNESNKEGYFETALVFDGYVHQNGKDFRKSIFNHHNSKDYSKLSIVIEINSKDNIQAYDLITLMVTEIGDKFHLDTVNKYTKKEYNCISLCRFFNKIKADVIKNGRKLNKGELTNNEENSIETIEVPISREKDSIEVVETVNNVEAKQEATVEVLHIIKPSELNTEQLSRYITEIYMKYANQEGEIFIGHKN